MEHDDSVILAQRLAGESRPTLTEGWVAHQCAKSDGGQPLPPGSMRRYNNECDERYGLRMGERS
jgi:hypothetical protein